jgi:L-aspartate oxidase
MKKANRELKRYTAYCPGKDLLAYYEIINMITTARIIIQAALWRKESRGGHYRSDYPQRDYMRWLKHTSFVNC